MDNLAIGGFQRLALDQAYSLSENGYSVRLLVLTNSLPTKEPNFLNSEQILIEKFDLKIDHLGNSRLKQAIKLNRMASKLSSKDLLLSHSLRATILLAVQKFRLKSGPKLISVIHQLPTLSAPRQRFQRYCYAQFTDVLIGYSVAVKKDWIEKLLEYPKIFRLIFKKPISVIRNGIYLSRLPQINLEGKYRPRLIYLGRNTSWKGVNTFFEIARSPLLKNFDILIMVPNEQDISINQLEPELAKRLQVVPGKTIASLNPHPGDVHIYPANYGSNSKHIESISLNCLEFAAIGIPSILTQDGIHTWRDLERFHIFFESDWKITEEVATRVIEVSQQRILLEDLNQVRNLISIQNNINQLINISTF